MGEPTGVLIPGKTAEELAGRICAVRDNSFELFPVEILGLAGAEGNGQTELVEALVGTNKSSFWGGSSPRPPR